MPRISAISAGSLVASLLSTALVLPGCGNDASPPAAAAPPAAPLAASAEEVDTMPTGQPMAPGRGMGLGAGSAAEAPTQRPAGSAGSDPPVAAPAAPAVPAGPIRGAAALPEPKLPAAEVYGDASGLARDAQDPRFGEFRGLTAQNTTLLVDVARARSAMRERRAGADEAYREADARFAALSDRINQYMAQPRWTQRDREIMGYLYSLSNEEAIRQVRSSS